MSAIGGGVEALRLQAKLNTSNMERISKSLAVTTHPLNRNINDPLARIDCFKTLVFYMLSIATMTKQNKDP